MALPWSPPRSRPWLTQTGHDPPRKSPSTLSGSQCHCCFVAAVVRIEQTIGEINAIRVQSRGGGGTTAATAEIARSVRIDSIGGTRFKPTADVLAEAAHTVDTLPSGRKRGCLERRCRRARPSVILVLAHSTTVVDRDRRTLPRQTQGPWPSLYRWPPSTARVADLSMRELRFGQWSHLLPVGTRGNAYGCTV